MAVNTQIHEEMLTDQSKTISLFQFIREIINGVGVVGEQSSGWKKELNRISWNGGEPKYDLRDWSPDHEKMGKGITLTEVELRSLKEIIDAEIELLDTIL